MISGSADLVLTGEGKLDRQTLSGKAPIGVARIARQHGVECVAVAGQIEVETHELQREGLGAAASVVQTVGDEAAFADPAEAVARTVELTLRRRAIRFPG